MDVFHWAVSACACAALPLLYLLWKHHPSYGANPGAPAFPLVGCIPFILLNKHRFYEWTCELFDRSPSLTRSITFGRTIVLSTADPQVVHHILKSHFLSYPKGPSFYPFFFDLLGNGIFNCDGALWRLQRKVASHVFTTNSLRDFVVAIADAEIVGRLLPAVDDSAQRSDANSFINLQALLMHYTFDTICQLTFGSDPACLDSFRVGKTQSNGNLASMSVAGEVGDSSQCNGNLASMSVAGEVGDSSHDASMQASFAKVPDHLIQGFVQSFQAALQIIAERFLMPSFVWRLKRSLKVGSEKRLMDAMELVNRFTSFVIEQSKRDLASGKARRDLLTRFVRLSSDSEISVDMASEGEQENARISDTLLKDILLSFILAGRETVASGISFTIWLLSIHPEVEREVLKEINGILKDRESNPMPEGINREATFSYDEVRKMDYLQAVLSESMRLYPPVPSDCKYAAHDDTLPDGTKVLKGYQVSYNVFAMGRAARVWGEDCLEFKPERWLDKESGAFVPASPFKYPVFQAGPRMCLGKDFALIQMKLVVASLVRNFAFAVQPGFKPKLSYGVSMIMVNGLPVRVTKRSTAIS